MQLCVSTQGFTTGQSESMASLCHKGKVFDVIEGVESINQCYSILHIADKLCTTFSLPDLVVNCEGFAIGAKVLTVQTFT